MALKLNTSVYRHFKCFKYSTP